MKTRVIWEEERVMVKPIGVKKEDKSMKRE